MNKIYSIFLGEIKIGTTRFENADAPMGVVFGIIEPCDSKFGYDFLKDYCQKNQINLVGDYPEEKVILTKTIKALKILNENGIEIKGGGNQISGMDGDEFEIAIECIPYPFYEEEFPHHVKAYEDLWNNKR